MEFEVMVVKAAMMIVGGCGDEDVVRWLGGMKVKGGKAREVVKEARGRIVRAAEVDRKVELGRAIKQYDAQYDAVCRFDECESVKEKHEAVALARSITEKRVELLRLKEDVKADVVADGVQDVTSQYVRGHLEGLGLTEKGLPLEELARQVCAEVAKMERKENGK